MRLKKGEKKNGSERGMLRLVFGVSWMLILVACTLSTPEGTKAESNQKRVNADKQSVASDTSPQKRALIVALNTYESSTGWWNLASDHDIPLIQGALNRHGFVDANIQVLPNEQATKEGIIEAFTSQLIEGANKGDVLVFHYSGHGQQLTDDENGEELDGYDEAIVPYDAPLCPGEVYKRGVCVPQNYQGEKHLRDDDLHTLVQRARQQVGPKGNVVVFLDSCFSGTGTRGRLNVRGSAKPLGFPKIKQARGKIIDEGGGYFEGTQQISGSLQGLSVDLAPYVVFSAARNNQLAYQTESDEALEVGSLSLALSKALLNFGKGTSYRTVFDHVKWVLQGRVLNEPQIEGDKDSELFNGQAISQVPYVEVDQKGGADSQVYLKAGSLAGLLSGSQVEFHKVGTHTPSESTKLGEGEVETSSPFQATVGLSDSTPRDKVNRSWAFVTQYAFGDLRLGAHIKKLSDPKLQQQLEATLNTKVPAIDLTIPESKTDLVIRESQANDSCGVPIVVENAQLGSPILGPLCAKDHDIPDLIGNRLVDYTRNQYFRKLWVKKGNLDVSFQVIPIEIKDGCIPEGQDNPLDCIQKELDPKTFLSVGGQLQLPLGTYFKLRAHSPQGDAHITILDLVPDGTIGMLWPPRGTSDKTPLKKGEDTDLPGVYQIEDPKGQEVFLLVATQEWVNFEPFLSKPNLRARGKPRGNLGPFVPLFNDLSIRTRAKTIFPKGSVTTQAITVSVIP